MKLDNWHLVFVSLSIFLVLTIGAPAVIAHLRLSIKEEKFFALAVLGEDGMTDHYYPNEDQNIEVGEDVHWNIYLYNHMGESQYIAVRIKLLNSTNLAPNSTSCSPSPSVVVYEVRRVLLDNETWLYPFSWSIQEIEQINDFVQINLLAINNDYFKTHAFAKDGNNFRFILELWIFNESLQEFQFSWIYNDKSRCAWNQIWFKAIS